MMQKSTARSPQQQQQNSHRTEPSGRIVVGSVVSHASLLAAISDRNPIIAKRTTSDEDKS